MMRKKNRILTRTAGGIVIQAKTRNILLVSQRKKVMSLPKGHIDQGETKLQAAVREIYEESGVENLELLSCLGYYKRYKISANGFDDHSELKKIIIFLFKTSDEYLEPQDPDNPEAFWVLGSYVLDLLTHPIDKSFFSKFYQRYSKKYSLR